MYRRRKNQQSLFFGCLYLLLAQKAFVPRKTLRKNIVLKALCFSFFVSVNVWHSNSIWEKCIAHVPQTTHVWQVENIWWKKKHQASFRNAHEEVNSRKPSNGYVPIYQSQITTTEVLRKQFVTCWYGHNTFALKLRMIVSLLRCFQLQTANFGIKCTCNRASLVRYSERRDINVFRYLLPLPENVHFHSMHTFNNDICQHHIVDIHLFHTKIGKIYFFECPKEHWTGTHYYISIACRHDAVRQNVFSRWKKIK